MNSPYLHGGSSVPAIMVTVVLALVPGIAVSIWQFGWGVFWQIALALAVGVALEAGVLRWRGQPVVVTLRDGSVIVLALLLGLALPPYAPWWLNICAVAFAVLLAKHAFGGIGQNLFNPAMAGFVFVLVCFPRQLSSWPDALRVVDDYPGPWLALRAVFGGDPLDAWSGATVLTYTKAQGRLMVMLSELAGSPVFGRLGGRGYEWVNLAFLLGGLVLVVRRQITWRIPAAMLGSLFITALILHGVDPERFRPAVLHLFSGATMLGAFFIATDPVTAAITPRGQVLFGAGVGILIYVMRYWGAFPDGVAIAVLTMNALVPLLDRLTPPRMLGGSDR